MTLPSRKSDTKSILPSAQSPVLFHRQDEDLHDKLFAFIGTKLMFLQQKVDDPLLARTQRNLTNHFKKLLRWGKAQHYSSTNELFNFEKRANEFRTIMKWPEETAYDIFCNVPTLLVRDSKKMAEKWKYTQEQNHLSINEFMRLLKNPLGASALIYSSRTTLNSVANNLGTLGRDALGHKENKDAVDGPILNLDDWKAMTAEKPGLIGVKPQALRKGMQAISHYFQTPLLMIADEQAKILPPEKRAYRTLLTKVCPRLPNIGQNNCDTIAQRMTTTIALTDHILLADDYPLMAVKNPDLITASPATIAKKAALLACAVDMGVLPKTEGDDPYQKLQQYLIASPNRLNWSIDNFVLRMAIAKAHGNHIFAGGNYDPLQVEQKDKKVDNFNLLNLPLKDLKLRFKTLHPEIEISAWLEAQKETFNAIEEHAKNKHFNFDKTDHSMQLLCSHPAYHAAVKFENAMKEKRFGHAKSEITHSSENNISPACAWPNAPQP